MLTRFADALFYPTYRARDADAELTEVLRKRAGIARHTARGWLVHDDEAIEASFFD
jgi:hypothetical protein